MESPMLVCTWFAAKAENCTSYLCPGSWEERIREAVRNQQEMERLIEELSDLEWKRLQQRKE
jgi:hypothetical protein